jgi:tetratricopeptide (TPR) repeat protein
VIRDFLEREYEDLRSVFEFNYPGKAYVFLCPCEPEDMDFEPGFGISVDPGRLAGYAVYSRARNAVDPLMTNLMKFYRWWGYAPRLLSWGIAGYTDFSDFYAKQYLRDGRLPQLSSLVRSIDFRRADPWVAYFTASSFAHYLVQTAGSAAFKDLYERSTDLSLKPAFLAVTEKTLDQWETEWRRYLRQRQFRYPEYIFHAHRAQAILRQDEHIRFLQLAIDDMADSVTIPLLLELAGAYYGRGDYGSAYTYYKKVVEAEPTRAAYHQYFGNICTVLGRLDEAIEQFEIALDLDSSFTASHLSLGEVMASRGMLDSALTLWRIGMDSGESIPVGIELILKLEQFARQHHQPPDDPEKIIIARNLVTNLLGQYPDNPRYLMRMGNVLTEMGKPDSALAYFDAAEFFERRPFFQALIHLSRGKALDRARKRREAVAEYEKVFDYQAGYLTRREAEKYINSIYR